MDNLITKIFFIEFDALLFIAVLGCSLHLYDKQRILNKNIATNCMDRGSIFYTKDESTERSDIVLGSQVISEIWDYEGNKQIYINNTDVTDKKQDISYLSGALSMTGKYVKEYENQGSVIRYKKM